jgi:Domain of unknown function (DUF4424)
MRAFFSISVLVLLTSTAYANDSMAELGVGGIQYVTSPDVSMAEERLYISAEKVAVDYVFINKSDKDVETLVAFPLPDIAPNPDGDIAIRDSESDNFLGFVASQDGKPIDVKLQQRARVLNIDVTDELVAAGVPLAVYREATAVALQNLNPAILQDWQSRGIVTTEEWDDGSGMKAHILPNWTLQSAYWWKTKYPANASVSVSHTYSTGTGGTVAVTFLGDDQDADDSQLSQYRKKYCVDDDFIRSVEKKIGDSNSDNGPNYTESWISYILSTGSNWSGPIGKFKLIVDKGSPDNFVSFCGDGVKKTGPTTFEMEKTDFWPEEDLHILIVNKVQN